MIRITALACLVLAGCSDLPSFDEAVCGNYVIDPGETCDGDDPACEECALLCDGALPGGACEAPGFACGVDGFCHAASGSFGDISGAPVLNASAMLVTDVDQDHINDVVALSGTSLTVNYGDAGGGLGFQTSTLTPFFQAAPAFGHLDADDSLDVILPTADGVVAYSSPHGVLAPHSFAIDLATTTADACNETLGQPFNVFSVDEQYLGVLYMSGANIGIALIDSSGRTACPRQTAVLCTLAAPADPRTFPIDVYDVSFANPATGGVDPRLTIQSRVIAVVTPGGACTANVTRTPVAAPPFQISTQLVTGMIGRPILADLVGAGCPSMIDSHSGGPVVFEHRGMGLPGNCSFDALTNPITLAGPGFVVPSDATAVGHVRLEPPVSSPTATYRKDAIVLTSGIYAVRLDRLAGLEMYRADRPLTFVDTGDLDDDGDLDVASIGFGTDDLDLLYRSGTSNTFLRVRVDTRGPITQFVVGDFDGNHASDVAYTERVLGGDRLMLAYGTHDRLLDPVESGAFSLAVGLCPVQTSDTTDPHQLVSDLVIIDKPDDLAPPIFTLLHGSPQRTMLSYFDPRMPPFGSTPTTVFDGLAVGNLAGPSAKTVDIFSIETGANPTKLWKMPNSPGGLVLEPGINAVGVDDCHKAPTPGGSPRFCTPGARYLSWPLATHDVVLGIADGDPRVITLDPEAFANGYAPRMSAVLDGHEELAVRSAYAVELGGPRLVVSFGPRMLPELGPPGGTVQLCTVDGQGIPTQCDDLATLLPELAGWHCVDAAPASIGGANQLVVACHGTADGALYRVSHDGAALHAARLRLGPELTGPVLRTIERIVIGDVTGDTLDDLLAVSIAAPDPEQHVLVVPQCSTSEVSCIDDASDGGGQ